MSIENNPGSRFDRTLDFLFEFATKHKGDDRAALVLASFCRGECEHYGNPCELCGTPEKGVEP